SAPPPRCQHGSSPTEPMQQAPPAGRPSPTMLQAACPRRKIPAAPSLCSAESRPHERHSHSSAQPPIIRGALMLDFVTIVHRLNYCRRGTGEFAVEVAAISAVDLSAAYNSGSCRFATRSIRRVVVAFLLGGPRLT